MTHPITPPPELVEQWYDACILEGAITYDEHRFAAFAAQWGADQELEACCEWLEQNQGRWEIPASLRAARRPKPPSLKEQARGALDRFNADAHTTLNEMAADFELLRMAVEQLDD